MDCEVKKQRRRSIRNLRRSACFVPPTLDYGSAWVGENQETNISNLVRSFEELNCADAERQGDHLDEVAKCPQNPDVFQFVDEEAQDGFEALHFSSSHPDKEVSLEDNVRISAPCLNLESQSLEAAAQTSHSENLDGSLNRFVDEDTENEHASHRDINHTDKDHRLLFYPFQGSIQSSPNYAGDADNETRERLEKFQSEKHPTNNSSVSYGPHDSSMSPEFTDFGLHSYSVEYDQSDNSMNQAMTFNVSRGLIFNTSFSPMESRPDTPQSSPSNLRRVSIGKQKISEIICSLEEPIISADPDTSLLFDSKKISLIGSTSCAQSCPVGDSVNVSVSALQCSTMGSVNGSMPLVTGSAMDSKNRSASSIPSCTNHSENVAASSIPNSTVDSNNSIASHVTCSTMDSNNSVVSSLQSQDVNLNSQDSGSGCTTGELNSTYTLESSEPLVNELNEIENHSGQCFETSPLGRKVNAAAVNSQEVGADICDASNLSIVDFEYKKPNSSKRRSSNFFSDIPTPQQHVPTFASETSLNSCGDDFRENILDSSTNNLLSDYIQNGSHQIVNSLVNLEEETKDSTDLSSTRKENAKYFGPVEEGNEEMTVQVDLSTFDVVEKSSLQFSPRTALSDCGNGNNTVLPTAKKTKQPRRKLGELNHLLKESSQFLTQNLKHADKKDSIFHNDLNLNKENEYLGDMTSGLRDAHWSSECVLSAPAPTSRSLRKRPGRKSGDFRKEVNSFEEPASVVRAKGNCSRAADLTDHGQESVVTVGCFDLELQAIYGKQTYVATSPQPLETVKESGREVFGKRSLKRYLKFGTMTSAKEKKRLKKALDVYKGRQCFFPVTEQDFDRKMLDIQLLLDFDLDCS